MTPRSAYRAAVVFAAASRAAYLAMELARSPLAAFPLHDAARYDAWARALAAGRAFEPGAFSQAPLYPFLLAGVYALAGPHVAAAFVLQAVTGVATVALAGLVARRARGEAEGALAAWIVALYAPLAFFETKLLPAAWTVLLAVLLVERLQAADAAGGRGRWAAAGAAAGALALASAAYLLAIPVAAAWIAADRRRAGRSRAAAAARFALAAACVVAPATAANRLASGAWTVVTTNGGITFWQGNNPAAEGVFSVPEGFSGAIATQRAEARALAEAETGRSLDDAAASRHWFRRGLGFLAGDPARAITLLGRKAAFAVASVEQPLCYSPRLDANPVRRLMPLPFALVLAAAAAALAFRRPVRAEGPAWIVAGIAAATLVAFFVASRYRLPAVPALAAVGGGAVAATRRPRAWIAAGVAAAVSLAAWPALGADMGRRQDAMTWDDTGNALAGAGRLEESLVAYGRSLALAPDSPFAAIDRGKALSRLGRRRDAENALRAAAAAAPTLPEAHFELGLILFDAGRLDEAASSFSRAFALAPGDADAGNNLAGTLLKLGRTSEAREVVRSLRERRLPVDPPLARALGE